MFGLRFLVPLVLVLGCLTASADDECRAFALLREGKYEEAHALFMEELGRRSVPYDGRVEFRERWADALSAAGYQSEALVEREMARSETPEAEKRPYVQPEVRTFLAAEPKSGRPGRTYFIAPGGQDDADGSLEHPFATVARVQRVIRQLKTNRQYPKGGITVFIRRGTYPMAPGLAFDEYDSGEPGSPVTWRPYGNERPVFDGGWKVPALKPVADAATLARLPTVVRDKVRCCDVRAAGYAPKEVRMPSGKSSAKSKRGPVTDLYADGVRLAPACGADGVRTLDALDEPGEWYLDAEDGVLYVWPPEKGGELVLSEFSDVFLEIEDLHDVRFGGLTFQNGRFDAVVMKDCSNVRFARNVIRNFGGNAIAAVRAKEIRVTGNAISNFGEQGVVLSGGNRQSLTSAKCVIDGNDFSFLGSGLGAGVAAVRAFGCGIGVVRNRLHDLPAVAIRLEGSDLCVFSNAVDRMTGACGAIDIPHVPASAVNLVSYNEFRDVATPVRLGEDVSCVDIHANRFERCGRTGSGVVQINGGRNNVVDGNTFVDCPCGVSISPSRGVGEQVNLITRNLLTRTPQTVSTTVSGTRVSGNRHR